MQTCLENLELTNIDPKAMLELVDDQAQEVPCHPISNGDFPWKHKDSFYK